MPLGMNTVNKYFAMTWENLLGQPLNGKGSQGKAQKLNAEMTRQLEKTLHWLSELRKSWKEKQPPEKGRCNW